MAYYAVIEIGTTSLKLLLAEQTDMGLNTITDCTFFTHLGRDISEHDCITEAAQQRFQQALDKVDHCLKPYQLAGLYVIGTMTLRKAQNPEVITTVLQSRYQVSPHILSGEEEAECSFLAGKSLVPETVNSFSVIDIGGGSTEIIFAEQGKIKELRSFNLAAGTLTDIIKPSNPVNSEDLLLMNDYIGKVICSNLPEYKPELIIGMGGTFTSMAAIKLRLEKYQKETVNKSILTRDEIYRQIRLFILSTVQERKSIIGLNPERAEIILAGAMIADRILDTLSAQSITITTNAVRHGYLYLLHQKHFQG